MDDKEREQYEDINFDAKDVSPEVSSDDIEEQTDDNSEELDELQTIAQQMSKDFADYFKFNITSEQKETEDAVEDLLTHLEEFCGLIEMIRNDNNICLEEVLKKITEKSKVMDEIYTKIDKLDQLVQIVNQCVGDMENELTKAEQLFGDNNNNKVKKFFSSFINNTSKKQNNVQRIKANYEPKEIFRASDYIKRCDFNNTSDPSNDHNLGQSSQTIDPNNSPII